MMSSNRFGALLGVAAVLLSACASPEDAAPATMASLVTIDDPWASAADSGMTAVFGTLVNAGAREVHIVGGESPAAGLLEIHEIASGPNGAKTMRPKASGITIAPNGMHELAPGGDHLMLMDLKEPLRPGADVAVTVTFEDGSTLPVTAQVRDFTGGNEEYSPGTHDHG